MEVSQCMYEEAVNGLLGWREEEDMPATANFYKLVLAHTGSNNFAHWAKASENSADMSHFMRNKVMTDVDRLDGLKNLNTTEMRVSFLEDNFKDFMQFAKERYCPYVVTLDQLDTIISNGKNSDGYASTLDAVMVLAITNMGMSYRHYIYHFLNKDGSSNHTDAKGRPIGINGELLENTKD